MEVKVNKIVGFKSNVSGKGEKYDVSADVAVDNGSISNLVGGTVKDSGGTQVATFTLYGNLDVVFATNDNAVMTAAITDINAFVDYCKTNFASLNAVTA